MSDLSISLLGAFAASLNKQSLTPFRTKSVQALLIYLICEAERPHQREALMELLWPGLPRMSAQSNLRQTLYRLRQAIPEVAARDGEKLVPLILADRQAVKINPAAAYDLDINTFTALIYNDPAGAAALYRDDFLVDFYLPDSNLFEEWAAAKRAELRRLMLAGLDALARHHLADEAYDDAQRYAWRQLELDDLRESAVRQLMIALTRRGQRSAALAQYQLLHRRLHDELGVEPSTETNDLYQRIQADALREAEGRQAAPPPSTSQGRPIFLFTDIESSTPLWEKHREVMLAALLQHNAILEQHIPKHGGRILELRGDGVKAVFEGVDPLPCVLDIQREFGRADWGELGELKIRIGLHGVPADLAGHDYFVKEGKYFGPVLNQAARVMDVGHGGQILVSEPVRMRFNLPPGAAWQDFGLHHFKGIDEPLKVYGLLHPDLPHQTFPPLRLPSEQPDRPESELERPPQPEPVIPHNLPQQLTTFVGREEEVTAITALINQHRLVMLTGIGGIGKTGLCLQVGRQMLAAFPDGVWLVELAPLADPALVSQAAAYALGLREASEPAMDAADPGLRASPSRSILQRLLDYLQERHCLLILDNCEHLIQAVAHLAETLLQACPEVKILASSREVLGVPGEVPFQVPPLSIPNLDQPPSLDEWQHYDALQLFVDRATTVLPAFQVTPANITHLVQICQRLDGIPLALELAAARVKVLSTEQIAARLDDRFHLLTGGRRTALPRQQTLRALIDWSWELLTEAEQLLLPRLSVFAGGMTLEAVEAVCAGDGLDVYDLLDLLSELVNKSLVIVHREQGQETRYRLLETIRQYAQEKLGPTEQRQTLRQRHLNYFLHLAEQAEPALFGPDQAAWLQRLDQELDNLRLALKWALETDREAGIRLITTVWPFWDGRYVSTGEAWLVKLLAQAELIAPDINAQAFWVSGRFNYRLGHFDRARLLLEKSLALYRDLGDPQGLARCHLFMTQFMELEERQTMLLDYLAHFRASGDKLGAAEVLRYLGGFAGQQNNYEQARLYLRESESLYRELGHLAGIADVLNTLGTLAIWQEDYDGARPLLEEGLAIDDELGSRSSSSILLHLGILHFRRGDDQRARTYLEKGLSLSQQTGEYPTSCWILAHLGYVCLREGELAQARHFFLKSLHKFREMEYKIGVDFTLEGLASLAVSQKQPARAVRLFAWTEATRAAMQNPRPPSEQADVARDMAAIREMMNEEAYAAAYAEGKAMTMEKAVACALEMESS